LVHYTSIKVGVTNGYICLALLKQIWVIADPSAISPYPGHFWFVRRAANRRATTCLPRFEVLRLGGRVSPVVVARWLMTR
jgi:hypothetical protein